MVAGAVHHGPRGRRAGGAVARHDPSLLPRGQDPRPRLQGTIRPVRFLWSEVEAAWDGPAQLSLEDRVA